MTGAGGTGPSVDRGKSVSTPIDYHGTEYQPVWPSSHMPVRVVVLRPANSRCNANP